ncbi:MAG: hypothetical protein IAG13_22010, partial [Deltaproteobacteria bacterium]|nr:hypothetical protein [Nannocystaceae bacterium]
MATRSPLLATVVALGLGFLPLPAAALGWLGFSAAAWAQPYRGSATSAPEPKDKTPGAVRQRALSKARRAALELALAEVGKVGKTERKSALAASDAWTGAYRVLSERAEGESVAIEVEVEIDVARLRKKVAGVPASSAKPLFALGSIEAVDACGSDRVRQVVKDELTGAQAITEGGAPLQISISCTPLGPVPHTFVLAARAVVEATSDARVVARA